MGSSLLESVLNAWRTTRVPAAVVSKQAILIGFIRNDGTGTFSRKITEHSLPWQLLWNISIWEANMSEGNAFY